MPKVTAGGKTFNFPEGTTNEQIGQAIDEYFSSDEVEPIKESLTEDEFQATHGDAPDIFGQVIPEEPRPEVERGIGEQILGAGETALTAATGATGGTLGLMGGTLQGIITELRSGEFGSNEAAQRIADRAEAAMADLTYQPRTEAGQEITKSLGEVAEVLTPLAGLAGPVSQIGQSARLAKPQLLRGAKTAATQSKGLATDIKRAKLPSTKAQVKELMRGEVDRDVFDVELAGSTVEKPSKFQKLIGADLPDIQKNKEAINAANQGFDEGFLDVIAKRATPEDRRSMLEMTRISEKGKKDPLFEVDSRPSDVAGGILLDKVNEVKRINRDAGRAIGREAEKLKGEKVEVAKIGESFKAALDDMDISINEDLTLNFDKSFLKTLAGPKKSIKVVFDEMAANKNPTALDLHKLKKFIDEQVTYGKNVRGLGGNAERSLKNLRKDINKTLNEQFPSYAKANKAYSQTIDSLDEIQRLAGNNTDLTSNSAEGSLGVLSRRLMSNAQSRGQLNEAIKSIDSSIKAHEGFSFEGNRLPNPNKKPKPNLKLMMLYADELDKVVGSPAKTSHTGSIDTSIAVAENARNQTLTGVAIDAAKELRRRQKGINRQGAYESMQKILRKQSPESRNSQ